MKSGHPNELLTNLGQKYLDVVVVVPYGDMVVPVSTAVLIVGGIVNPRK